MALFFEKNKKTIRILLIFFSIIAALKTIFVCISVDEEYQLSMGYRLLRGEHMFVDLWDPHQTSVFLTEFLMWIYHALFSTFDGVVIWIRFGGTMLHLAASYAVFRLIRVFLSKDYAFYLAVIFFHLLPKNSVFTDYSLMFIWSLTFLLVHLFYLQRDHKLYHSVFCGFWMCIMVLSYPSAVLIFPVVLILLLRETTLRKKYALSFVITCLIGGLLYLCYVLSITESLSNFIALVMQMLRGQSSHVNISPWAKTGRYLVQFLLSVLLCGLYCLIAKLILLIIGHVKKVTVSISQFMLLSLTVGLIHHILHWLLMLWEFERAYNYALYILIFAFVGFTVKELDTLTRKTAITWILLNLAELLCVLILTDLTVYASLKYMTPGAVIGLCALIQYIDKKEPAIHHTWTQAFLLFFCFTSIFVRIWQYPTTGGIMSNILNVRGIVKNGPEKGILSEYMTSYMERSTAEEFESYVPEGSSLFIVDVSPIAYMYKDVNISSYTTICSAVYNEVLFEYWDAHPEKYPDVVAVSCWYGTLHWDPDSWIVHWVENEFPASRIIDGKYYRYYIND
ncbi:MAG: hypothetical protein K5682_11180 [Lachnospiraceae bacterium]|nr:hypothetical protein [Lachnospiraceae bacterium]